MKLAIYVKVENNFLCLTRCSIETTLSQIRYSCNFCVWFLKSPSCRTQIHIKKSMKIIQELLMHNLKFQNKTEYDEG